MPNLWDGEFTTSTIIVAKSIEPLAAPLTPQQQADRPYAMGAMEIVPAFSTKFNKQTELSTFMLIYNAKTDPTNNKPDVTVEYNFYAKQSGGEKFFNKTNPQALNAQTLPPQFRLRGGSSASERTGGAARVVPGRGLSARDQGRRQAREQDADARNQFFGQRVVA